MAVRVLVMDERRAVLVAAGELSDEEHLLELLQGGLAVAVDGGLAHFRALKVVPDLLLGDLDSVSDDDRHWAEAGGCEVVELPSQESSDLAKAMAHMNHIGRTRVTIAAAAGGRADHQLAVWGALADAPDELDISIHLGGDMGLRCCDRLRLGMQEGTVLSLFALRSATVSLSGTSWPLERERIEFSDRGLSNLAEGGPVLLEVHEGGPVLMILSSGDND